MCEFSVLGVARATHIGAERAVWFGGGRLAKDLALPSLRQGWQQSASEQQHAVKEWSQWTSSPLRTHQERRAELEARAVGWYQCVHDVDRLRRQLRGVDGDPAGTARVARDAAGILAAWSVALEADRPGPLARASRQLARSAELRASHRAPAPRPRARGSTLALYMLAGARPDSTAGWFLLARQLTLLGGDLARLHHRRGELDRARELQTQLASQLRQVHQAIESPSAPPAADLEVTAAIQRMLKPLGPHTPGAPDSRQEATAARRVIDVLHDRRRPRGR